MNQSNLTYLSYERSLLLYSENRTEKRTNIVSDYAVPVAVIAVEIVKIVFADGQIRVHLLPPGK